MEKVLYIDSDEEITGVISKIKKITSRKVAVVIPKGAIVLGSIVNLKMLKRHEKDLGKEITIITTDRTGLHLASEVGFSALRSFDKANLEEIEKEEKSPDGFTVSDIGYAKDKEKQEQKDGPNIVFKKDAQGKDNEPEISSKKVEDKKEEKKKPKKKLSKKMKWALLGFGLVAVFASFLGFLFVLPKAEIVITPTSDPLNEEVEIKVALNEDGDVLGEFLEIGKESSKTQETTGTKNIGEKAKGTITVYNYWDSDPQPLVSGTRFISDGKTFRTTAAVTVPGTTVSGGDIVPGTANVNVEASDAGEIYNIGPSTFTIPGLPQEKQEKIYGKSAQAMSGGSTKTVKVVSKADIDSLKTLLSEEMKNDAKEEINSKAKNKKVLDAAILEEEIEENYSAKEGQEADNLTLTIKNTYWTIIFSEDDVMNKIESKIEQGLEEEKEIVSGRLDNVEYKVIEQDKEQGLDLSVSITAYVVEKLELEQSKYDIPRMNSDEVIDYFNAKENILDTKIDFWPFWVKKVPLNRSRVYIEVNVQVNE